MSTGALDPLIHDPERLRIVAALAALPDGDALAVTRLQDMIRLPPGSLITGHKPGPAPGQGTWQHHRGRTPGGSS
jgi:hypothetical protein